jgi:hypothetical protein
MSAHCAGGPANAALPKISTAEQSTSQALRRRVFVQLAAMAAETNGKAAAK